MGGRQNLYPEGRIKGNGVISVKFLTQRACSLGSQCEWYGGSLSGDLGPGCGAIKTQGRAMRHHLL